MEKKPSTNAAITTTSSTSASDNAKYIQLQKDATFVIKLLKTQPGPCTGSQISDLSGGIRIGNITLDSSSSNEPPQTVMDLLKNSPLVRIDYENKTIEFSHPMRDVKNLVTFVTDHYNDEKQGVSREALIEYDETKEWATQIRHHLHHGDLIGLKHTAKHEVGLFPRNSDKMLVPLSSTVSCTPDDPYLICKSDVRHEVRVGDLIVVCNKTYRVSGTPLTVGNVNSASADDWLSTLAAPYSSSSIEQKKISAADERAMESGKSNYKFPFTAEKLPIEPPFQESSPMENVTVYKVGCTNDIRQVWHDTAKSLAGQYQLSNALLNKNLDNKLISLGVFTQELMNSYNHVALEHANLQTAQKAKKMEEESKVRKRRRVVSANVTNIHMLQKQP